MGDIYDNLTNTPLIEAVRGGDAGAVRELIDRGASVNEPGEQGWTPLNWAAGKGNLELVTLLVEKGADVFKTGRDQRTPNQIALAAGHADVVRFLREAEDRVEGEKPARPQRKYCKAYHLKDLRQFSGWSEGRINWKKSADETDEREFGDDDVVFVHQDLIVTQSIWANENVIFNDVTPEWQQFCASVLAFRVPDDLDLIVAASSVAATNGDGVLAGAV
jgi:ankyrin repeat protein